MSKTLFEPGSPTFNELVGNGKIHDVPKYQRDYSWDTEDWDDLWNDIEGIPDEQVHYMGYVVLQRTGDSRRYWIIDGQQRITTLSILALQEFNKTSIGIAKGVLLTARDVFNSYEKMLYITQYPRHQDRLIAPINGIFRAVC